MICFNGRLSKNFSQAEYHPGSATVYMNDGTVTFIKQIQDFRNWHKKPMYVISWYRTTAENVAVGGIANSNHKRGCAMDFHFFNDTSDEKTFIWLAKKWNEICKQYHTVGEMGIYKWGYHVGIQESKQAKANGHKFVHWDSRSGKQVNNPFAELRNI